MNTRTKDKVWITLGFVFTMIVGVLWITGCPQQPQGKSPEEAAALETAQDLFEEQALMVPAGDPDQGVLDEALDGAIDETVPQLPTDKQGNELPDPDQGNLDQ